MKMYYYLINVEKTPEDKRKEFVFTELEKYKKWLKKLKKEKHTLEYTEMEVRYKMEELKNKGLNFYGFFYKQEAEVKDYDFKIVFDGLTGEEVFKKAEYLFSREYTEEGWENEVWRKN